MRDQNYDSTKALLLYANQRPILEELSDQERGRLLMALLDYAAEGLEPEFTGVLRMAFLVLQRDVDRNNRRWEETCRRRSAAGKKAAEARNGKNFTQEVSCENDSNAAIRDVPPAEPRSDAGAYSEEGPLGADADPAEVTSPAIVHDGHQTSANATIDNDRQQTLPNVTIGYDRQQTLPNVTIDNDRQRSLTNVGNQNQNQNQNRNQNQNQKDTPSQPPGGRERALASWIDFLPVQEQSACRALDRKKQATGPPGKASLLPAA